jgi:hypothetical protein
MSWKKWKLGLAVSLLSGVFTSMVGLVVGLSHQQILFMTLINVGKDGLLFLKDHPVESITSDTTLLKKSDVPPTKSL